MEEEWLSWPTNPDYAVSNYGEVKRIVPYKTFTGGAILGRVLTPYVLPERKGFSVAVFILDRQTRRQVAGMVLETFIGPSPRQGKEIVWEDGNPYNNRSDNLEWKPLYPEPIKVDFLEIALPGEKWKRWPGESYSPYFASTLGRVAILFKNNLRIANGGWKSKDNCHPHKILKIKNKKQMRQLTVGKFVLETFKKCPGEDYWLYRRDGDARNDKLSNLVWGLRPSGMLGVSAELKQVKRWLGLAGGHIAKINAMINNAPKVKQLADKLKVSQKKAKEFLDQHQTLMQSVEKIKKEIDYAKYN